MKTRQKTVVLLKDLEDWSREAFMDENDGWTIGWGRMEGVKKGDITTTAAEEEWLRGDILKRERFLARHVKVPLTARQHDALVLFIYNVGLGAFQQSTLLARLNAGDFADVPFQMSRWIFDDGEVSPGLMRRRAAEIRLWQIDRV